MNIKEITERSWLVEDEDQVGIISQKNQGGYLLIRNHTVTEFDSKDGLNQHFQADVFGANPIGDLDTPRVECTVRGFPVSHPDPIPVDDYHDLPLFAKREGTGVKFCAGYYGMNTPAGWRIVFCPKLSTLERYEFVGPCASRKAARQRITQHESC